MNGLQHPRASGTPMSSHLSVTSLRERAKARGEPDWLVEARVEAYERYEKLEAPLWRRTDLRGLDVEALTRKAWGRDATPARRAFVKQEGVVHMPLAEAAREHADLVRPLVAPSPRADKWEALQAALWTEGSLLYVSKGKELAAPVDAATRFGPEGGAGREILVLDRLAKANVLDRALGGGPGALVAHGVEMDVRDGAQLTLATLQDLDAGTLLLGWRRVHVQRDARVSWIDGQFGAGTSVTFNENLLAGQGGSVRFIGAFFGSAGQHMDITTAAHHLGAHTSSQLDMKGALSETGYSANYSIVNIGPDARNSSGHQHQETLLLSEGARADAIPKLDVENNDVSASHGATVGQVDPDQVFYLRSRGFSELGAKRLIVQGFFEPLLREIPVEGVRDEIGRALVGRLKG